jgi:DNA-directed RNA polymerase subunit beta'
MRAIVEGGEVIESLRDRILGRVAPPTTSLHPENRSVLAAAGQMLDEDLIDELEAAGVDEVKVRTALTCETRFGICAKCYGRDLGRGGLVNNGEAVGVIAAQSIGEPGTQLTMRTFHIGGAASRAAIASSVEAKSNGDDRLQRHDALRDQQQGRTGRDRAFRRDQSSMTSTAASASATRCRTARC